METINDIVGEMRCGMIPKHRQDRELLLKYAHRIEQAHEFELAVEKSKAAGEGYAAGKQSVTDCNQPVTNCHVLNTAKVREALEYLRDASREFCHLILNSKHNEIYDKYKYKEVSKIRDAIVNANFALAASARNEEEK